MVLGPQGAHRGALLQQGQAQLLAQQQHAADAQVEDAETQDLVIIAMKSP